MRGIDLDIRNMKIIKIIYFCRVFSLVMMNNKWIIKYKVCYGYCNRSRFRGEWIWRIKWYILFGKDGEVFISIFVWVKLKV